MKPEIANYKDYVRGDTINARRFTITQTIDGVESPVDLTGAEIRCHFILSSITIKFQIGGGITLIDAANGVFTIDSFKLHHGGKWNFDVEIKFPDGTVKTWVKGSINILKDVTK
jgi:hypothetical protein